MNNEQYILVIGAAHIDVFANYERELSSKIDKPGKIDFSLGGTALILLQTLHLARKKLALLQRSIQTKSVDYVY